MATISTHVDIISKNLADFFSSGYFLDISLSIASFSVKCNRLILAASSDYFRALLKFDEKSLLRNEFILDADYLTPCGVRYAINYIHSLGSDYADIPVDAYGDVYAASSFLQVVSLQNRIRDLILSILNFENCIKYFKLSTTFGDQEILNRSMTLLQNSFYMMDFRSPEFLSLSPAQIEYIFLEDQINVPQESFMVKALLSWVSHDETSKIEFFCQNFCSLLRLSTVSAEEFRKIMLDSSFQHLELPIRVLARWFLFNYKSPMFNEDQAKQLPSNIADILSSKDATLPLSLNSTVLNDCQNLLTLLDRGCTRVGTNFHVYSIGGVEDEFLMGGHRLDRSYVRNSDFFAYSSDLKKMLLRQPIPARPRVYHGVAASHTWIYLTGGEYDDGTMLDSCLRFNLVENKWSRFASLDAPRSHHEMACLDGIVYLFGGYKLNPSISETSITDSILTFNHVSNVWQTLSDTCLCRQLVDMAVVSVQPRDLILILGGRQPHSDDLRATNTCLAFRPAFSSTSSLDAWTSNASCKLLPSLPRHISHSAAVYHEPGDCVYLVGGRLFDGTPSNEIASFDLEMEQWSFVTALAIPRFSCSALIKQDKLYVFGGLTLREMLENCWMNLFFDESHRHDQPTSSHYAQPRQSAPVDQMFAIPLLSDVENPPAFRNDAYVDAEPDEYLDRDAAGDVEHEASVEGRRDSDSSTSASSTSSSWIALFPRNLASKSLTPRIIPANFQTCYIPETYNIVSSTQRPVPLDGPSPVFRDPLDDEDLDEYDISLPRRSRQEGTLSRNLLASYWLEPAQIDGTMSWHRRRNTLRPTLRRVRCLARYLLAPLFHSDVEKPARGNEGVLENPQSPSDLLSDQQMPE